MPGRALQHLHAHRGIGPRVAHELDPHEGQQAVRVAADGVVHPDRMALGMKGDGLVAVERHLHRPAGQHGHHRRLPLHRQVFLAAEPAAVGHQRHPYLLLRQIEQLGDLHPVVVDALALRQHLNGRRSVAVRRRRAGSALRDGDGALRLHEPVLDELGLVDTARGIGGSRPGRSQVAAGEGRARQQIARLVHLRRIGLQRPMRIGHRLQHVVLDGDQPAGFAGDGLRLGHHPGQHIADIARRLALGDHQRPVLADQTDEPVAGHV